MVKVKEIMTRNPVTIEAGKSLREAVKLMARLKIGSLMVSKGNEIIGILEEGDIIRNAMAKDMNPDTTHVEKVMSVPFIIDEERSDDEASEMMNTYHVRHLAVSSNSKIEGVCSMQDLIRPVYTGRSFWA